MADLHRQHRPAHRAPAGRIPCDHSGGIFVPRRRERIGPLRFSRHRITPLPFPQCSRNRITNNLPEP